MDVMAYDTISPSLIARCIQPCIYCVRLLQCCAWKKPK